MKDADTRQALRGSVSALALGVGLLGAPQIVDAQQAQGTIKPPVGQYVYTTGTDDAAAPNATASSPTLRSSTNLTVSPQWYTPAKPLKVHDEILSYFGIKP